MFVINLYNKRYLEKFLIKIIQIGEIIIKFKKFLISSAFLVLLVIILLSPYVLAETYTVKKFPNDYWFTDSGYGYKWGFKTDGDLDSFTTWDDSDYFEATGQPAYPGSWQFWIFLNLEFNQQSYPQYGNTVKIRFRRSGGAKVDIYVYYYGVSDPDHHSVSSPGSFNTYIYSLKSYKSVERILFKNLEWWFAGVLQISYCSVIYKYTFP